MKNKESKALVPHQQELTPQLWGMLESIGIAFYKSGKMSVHTAAEGAIKALFCVENKMPLTAARGLYFVNGRLGVEGAVIAALIRTHPDYDYEIKRLDEKGCTIAILRFGETIGEATFDESHAERAGLLRKHNYQSYPEDMYFNKAITRAQRRYAPDVFMAPTYSVEEMDDWQIIEGETVQRSKPPDFSQLIEQFGLEACQAAGVFTATNERDLWKAIDKLALSAATTDSVAKNEAQRAEKPLTINDIAQEIDSPFGGEAK